jgi:hypothetical protein
MSNGRLRAGDEQKRMWLFSTHITPRLQYIVDFISKELFDEPIRITSDKEEFIRAGGPRINYSDKVIAETDLFLQPHPLLFQSGIAVQEIECFELNFHPAFFMTGGDFSFDVLAASFYLISRYEEYLPHATDEYGRYAHGGSLAYREGFLDLPLVNIWLRELKTALARKYPGLVFRYSSFKFIPTYDIDSAFSYLHKGWKRNLGGSLKAIATGQWAAVKDRISVLQGRRPDPFDAYEWLDSLHLYCRMRPYYFFLVAARRKGVDRNISPSVVALQELIRYHAAGYRVGIHPSWQSGDSDVLLKAEVDWLENMTGRAVTRSRQHYIRFSLPGTYRRLVEQGIEQDFSMGYGGINGFRASVASSFYWYDLEKEEATRLRIFPFCFMDANAFYEQGYTPTQAMTELLHYYHLVRRVNGLMVTIWHNSFLGSDPQFAGWREVYEVFLKEEVYWDM